MGGEGHPVGEPMRTGQQRQCRLTAAITHREHRAVIVGRGLGHQHTAIERVDTVDAVGDE